MRNLIIWPSLALGSTQIAVAAASAAVFGYVSTEMMGHPPNIILCGAVGVLSTLIVTVWIPRMLTRYRSRPPAGQHDR